MTSSTYSFEFTQGQKNHKPPLCKLCLVNRDSRMHPDLYLCPFRTRVLFRTLYPSKNLLAFVEMYEKMFTGNCLATNYSKVRALLGDWGLLPDLVLCADPTQYRNSYLQRKLGDWDFVSLASVGLRPDQLTSNVRWREPSEEALHEVERLLEHGLDMYEEEDNDSSHLDLRPQARPKPKPSPSPPPRPVRDPPRPPPLASYPPLSASEEHSESMSRDTSPVWEQVPDQEVIDNTPTDIARTSSEPVIISSAPDTYQQVYPAKRPPPSPPSSVEEPPPLERTAFSEVSLDNHPVVSKASCSAMKSEASSEVSKAQPPVPCKAPPSRSSAKSSSTLVEDRAMSGYASWVPAPKGFSISEEDSRKYFCDEEDTFRGLHRVVVLSWDDLVDGEMSRAGRNWPEEARAMHKLGLNFAVYDLESAVLTYYGGFWDLYDTWIEVMDGERQVRGGSTNRWNWPSEDNVDTESK